MKTKLTWFLDSVVKATVLGLLLACLIPGKSFAQGPPPIITVQPSDYTAVYGGTATFTVAAASGTTLSYQWYKDGLLFLDVLLPGKTASALTLTNVGDSDVGQYFAEVKNAGGTVNSRLAALAVVVNSQPVANNDNYSAQANTPLVIPASGVLTNDTDVNGQVLTVVLATNVSQGTLSLSNNGSFIYAPPSNYFGSVSFVYRASDGYPVILQQNNSGGNDSQIKDNDKGAQSFRHGTAGGPNYTINKVVLYLSRKSGASGNLNFTLGTGINAGATAGSSRSISAASITNTSQGSSFQTYAVVYTTPVGPFTAGTTYYLNLDNQTSENVYVEYAGNTYANGTYYDDGSTAGGDMRFQTYQPATSNPATVTISVFDVNGNTPPSITSQPQSQTMTQGLTASFSVVAGGTAPLSYQWQYLGKKLDGATGDTLVLNNVQLVQAGNYSVTVSNVGGTAASAPASLTVVLPAGSDQPVMQDLVAHLTFDGDLADTSGRGNHAAAVGAPNIVPGFIGTGGFNPFTRNGTNNYATFGSPSDLSFGTNTHFSIAFWARLPSGGWSGSTYYEPAFIGNKDFTTYANVGWVLATGANGEMEWNYSEASPNTPHNYFGPAGAFGNTNWHHVAVTFQRGGNGICYLDGVPTSTNAISPGGRSIDTGLPTNIGNDGTGNYPEAYGYFTNAFGNPANGLNLDDVGIWRRVLSRSEIGGIYNAGLAGQDLASVTSRDVNSAGPWITVPGPQNTHANIALVFSSTNGNQISISGVEAGANPVEATLSVSNGTLTLNDTTGLTFTAGDGTNDSTMTFRGTKAGINTALNGLVFTPAANYIGAAALTVNTLDSKLVSMNIDAALKGRYTFDNTNNLGQSTASGGAYDGTVSGATAAVDGTRGTVLNLSAGNYVQIAGHFGNPANVTLAAWVNLTTATPFGPEVISLGDSVTLRLDDAGTGTSNLKGFIYDGSTWRLVLFPTTLAGTGWHHVAFTFDDAANIATLYLDGAPVASLTISTSISYTLGANSFIGKHGDAQSTHDFAGKIDEARVYSRALSATEISYLAQDLSLGDTGSVVITVNAGNNQPVANGDAYTTFEDMPLTTPAAGVLANDVDVDGDALTALLVSNVSNGSLSFNADGSFTYTPNTNFNGSDSFTYRVSDGVGPVATLLQQNVSGGSKEEIKLGQKGAQSFRHGNAGGPNYMLNKVVLYLSRDSQAPDANFNLNIGTGANSGAIAGSSVAIVPSSITNTTLGTSFQTHEIVFGTPVGPLTAGTTYYLNLECEGSNGKPIYFEYTASSTYANGTYFKSGSDDGKDMRFQFYGSTNSVADTATVTINVTPVNDAPVANIDWIAALEDTPVIITVLTNDYDVEGSPLTITGTSTTNGTAVISGTNVVFTPDTNYNGWVAFTYTVSDGTNSATAYVAALVFGVNDAPVPANDSYSTLEDVPLTIAAPGVIANDTDVEVNTLYVGVWTNVTHGALTLNTNGGFTYVPDTNYSGTDSFTYVEYDGQNWAGTLATVTINITPVDDAPVTVNDATNVVEDASVTIEVLANDYDPDGTPLTITDTSTTNGTAVISGTDIVFTPSTNFNGLVVFNYTVSDGTNSATANVTVMVKAVNDVPIAGPDNFSLTKNTTLNVPAAGVLINDTDVENDALSASLVSDVSQGLLSLNPDGSFTYTPADNYVGSDSFSYSANDASATSAVTTVSFTIVNTNTPPQTQDDSYTTTSDVPLTVPAGGILTNDVDADGDPLSAMLVADVSHGSLSLNSDGSFIYTPNSNYFGSDSFTYRASDDAATSAATTVSLTIVNTNAPFSIESGAMTATGFELKLSGPMVPTYVIEASTNLTDWTPISTNSGLTGNVVFTDTEATNFNQRFYRAMAR